MVWPSKAGNFLARVCPRSRSVTPTSPLFPVLTEVLGTKALAWRWCRCAGGIVPIALRGVRWSAVLLFHTSATSRWGYALSVCGPPRCGVQRWLLPTRWWWWRRQGPCPLVARHCPRRIHGIDRRRLRGNTGRWCWRLLRRVGHHLDLLSEAPEFGETLFDSVVTSVLPGHSCLQKSGVKTKHAPVT